MELARKEAESQSSRCADILFRPLSPRHLLHCGLRGMVAGLLARLSLDHKVRIRVKRSQVHRLSRLCRMHSELEACDNQKPGDYNSQEHQQV